MTWDSMKRFITCAFVLLSAIFITEAPCALAAPQRYKVPTIAVLSDTGHRNGTTYLICGAASDIIATDIINNLNRTGRIKAPLLGENMSKITQKNIPLYYLTFFREYKYNYNIDFVNLKRVTKNINTDYILMVTSGLDTQSEFLKETWWSKWGISSSEPLRPTYKLTTLVTLIDKKTYSIVWQDLYQREIKAKDMDLGVVQFSPSYSQLSKIKKYSKNMSEYVTDIVDRQVNPWIVPPQEPKAVEMKSRFLNEGTKLYYPSVNGEVVKENITDFKDNTQRKIEKYRQEREIKRQKHIENVNYQKQQEAQRKETVQKIQQLDKAKQPQKFNKKQEERLFDSIRNNIDDVSNTLPEPKQEQKEEQFIKPAVDIQPKTETTTKETPSKQEEPKLITPVMNKPQPAKETTVQTIQKSQPKPTQQSEKPAVQQQSKEELPKYNWNLKKI
ncbi:MAG: hypothetical protein KHX03_05435 [Clostridium sp.]|nr:hypothetical protein [Clostridium sp.]